MKHLPNRDFWIGSFQTAAVASLTTTTVAASTCGTIAINRHLAPVYSVSHIVWGDKAA